MDAFAVAVATSISLRRVSRRQVFRFAFHFGLFQAVMPVIGWAAGRTVVEHIRLWDHWVAFGLLGFIGMKAIIESFRHEDESDEPRKDPTRGLSLVMFSVATSIDALAVGLTFAMLDVTLWYPCLVIGVITAALTTFGMVFGARLGARIGKGLEAVGGLVLIGIGLKILVQHLMETPLA
ncbi:MAG: manganese efflux pump [bacterium]|nr:manganese efflux pump [bacterium]